MIYKWIYDNLYTKDNSFLLEVVKKFCEKIGYTPDNMDEFVRFLTNFDFVSFYDKVFNNPSYASQIYDYYKEKYVPNLDLNNYSNNYYADEWKFYDLYSSDRYIREVFKAFFFSYFLEDKREILRSYFYKEKEEPVRSIDDYEPMYKNLSLEAIKRDFYNWSTLVIFLEFPLRWVSNTLYLLINASFFNMTGISFMDRGIEEGWKYLKEKQLKAPDYLPKLERIYKFCINIEDKGCGRYINFIKSKGYLHEIELRKKMLGELLVVSFVRYLLLFITFLEMKYEDSYLYMLKHHNQYFS
ncbi:MAG: hypothetical protein NZM44_02375, partial [Candidatus Calescibacterium sp.]|nr:hypothetical protein [Candidatus Calescibacterium sp.]